MKLDLCRICLRMVESCKFVQPKLPASQSSFAVSQTLNFLGVNVRLFANARVVADG